MARTTRDDREECYARIKAVMEIGLRHYYRSHPHRLDHRADDAIRYSTKGLADILAVLDDYEITKKETP